MTCQHYKKREGAEDKTYARDTIFLFLFDGFESLGISLVDECRNGLVMNDVDVNLAVLNDLDRVNNLVGINFGFHLLVVNRMCKGLQRL